MISKYVSEKSGTIRELGDAIYSWPVGEEQ